MRYRIIIEVECADNVNRSSINALAMEMMDVTVSHWTKPVFVSTELAPSQTIEVLRK